MLKATIVQNDEQTFEMQSKCRRRPLAPFNLLDGGLLVIDGYSFRNLAGTSTLQAPPTSYFAWQPHRFSPHTYLRVPHLEERQSTERLALIVAPTSSCRPRQYAVEVRIRLSCRIVHGYASRTSHHLHLSCASCSQTLGRVPSPSSVYR
jgi:hypothetical protein